MTSIMSLGELVNLTVALGGAQGKLSAAETRLIAASEGSARPSQKIIDRYRSEIERAHDPFGEALYALRDATERRGTGTVYTPDAIIEPMVSWTLSEQPTRIVDAGCGSGRFAAAVARAGTQVHIVAIDLDPIATLMTRATLHVLGAADALVINQDFTRVRLPKVKGRTAFIGNPPYLRHHQIPSASKRWAQLTASRLGYTISGLAGLHAYFYLATAKLAVEHDFGCYVTSAEWLDVNYGAIVRNLLTGTLGGRQIHVIEPTVSSFEGTATTAAVVQFRVGGESAGLGFRAVPDLQRLSPLTPSEKPVAYERLVEAPRWSVFLRSRTQIPEGYIELGELARVHRGTVTGSNATWVARGDIDLPDEVLFRSITKARELFAAGSTLTSAQHLRHVIDLPADLDALAAESRAKVDRFLKAARRADVHEGYVAKNRRAWWSVGLKDPAPILATYMARRPPAFVRNTAEARHINIAHGLYPREHLTELQLRNLARSLSTSVAVGQGRTYAGGLTKFEPREMERLPIPDLDTLSLDASETASDMGLRTSRG